MCKKTAVLICTLLMCACTLRTAHAQPEPYTEPRCRPEEVDLSDVRKVNGRLVGEILIPGSKGQIRIDCALPEPFPAEQAQRLHVKYKDVGKKTLEAAMAASGQSTKAGKLRQWSDANQFTVSYSLWENNTEPSNYVYNPLMGASYCDDPACAITYSQAKETVQALLDQLGAATYAPLLHANRYDEAHCLPDGYLTEYSHGDTLRSDAMERFRKNARKMKHIEPGLTMVSGMFELYGLPVMYEYSWTEDGSRIGAESEFRAIVSDDGEVRMFQLSGLPTVKSAEQLTLPAYTWREMIARVASGWWLGNAHSLDEEILDFDAQPYTCYATYNVITEINPCWVGYERNQLVPGYYMVVEERTVKDNQLIAVWDSFGDAQTLTLIH